VKPQIIPRVLRDAALAYAQLGIKVFRVRPDKTPYANCVQCTPQVMGQPNPQYDGHRPEDCACPVDTCHGFHAATTDEATVRRWWHQDPTANIGAPCKANGWAVLDIDPRNGGHASLCALEQRVGVLPGTTTQITGGDGLHLIYRSPSVPLPATPFPGIDIKHNGYILLAPSVHHSGLRYQWPGDGLFHAPVTPWPEELLPKPKKRAVSARPPAAGRFFGTTDHIGDLVQSVMDSAPGTRHGRNNSLYTAACRAHALADRGLIDLHEAREALLAAARAVDLEGGDRQAEATFNSAANRSRRAA
jgi:hypothetical protein